MVTPTKEVEETAEDIATGTTRVALDPEKERDLLAGAASEVDGEQAGELEELGRVLDGYKRNMELQQAWIRGIEFPDTESLNPGDEVVVEFLLPSGDTFTQEFELPPRTWEEDNDLIRLLDHVGRSPAAIEEMIGDAVDVEHHNGDWELTLNSPDAEVAVEQPSREEETLFNLLAALVIGMVVLSHLFLMLFPLLTVSVFAFVLGFFTMVILPAGVTLYMFGLYTFEREDNHDHR